MNNDFKILMFISSFIPLWISIIILIVFNKEKTITSWIIMIVMILLTIISYIGLCKYIKKIKDVNTVKKCILKKAERKKELSSEYLLSYIMPLIAFDFTDIGSIMVFSLYITILGYLCIKNNNVYTNIILELKKYSFFSCEIEYELLNEKIKKNVLIISKEDIVRFNGQNSEIKYIKIDDDIYLNM